jgi:hypothetical protein
MDDHHNLALRGRVATSSARVADLTKALTAQAT